jgi:hypothetical protein
LTFAFAGIKKHPINLLSRTVITGVLSIAELVSISVKRPWGRKCLITLTSIDKIHEIGLYPSAHNVGVLVETGEPLRMLKKIFEKFFD